MAAACRRLLADWQHALRRESIDAYAWTVLKEHVDRWLRKRGRWPALARAGASGGAGAPGTAGEAAARRELLGEPVRHAKRGLAAALRARDEPPNEGPGAADAPVGDS